MLELEVLVPVMSVWMSRDMFLVQCIFHLSFNKKIEQSVNGRSKDWWDALQ